MRTLTPADQPETAQVEHLLDLVDLLTTVRDDEAMAEYVYAIAPGWDGTHRDAAPRGAGHHGLLPHRARELWGRAGRRRGHGGAAGAGPATGAAGAPARRVRCTVG